MKKYLIYSTLIIGLLIYSCELQEINENPNSPEEVSLELLLPGALANTASAMTEEFEPIVGIIMEYFEVKTINSNYYTTNYYSIDNAFYLEYVWQDLYTNCLIVYDEIIRLANETNSPYYSGIGKVMTAYSLGTLTSTWGDIPYSNALQGAQGNTTPIFDTQQSIYEAIQQLLDEAIEELNSEESVFVPAEDDIIYEGNTGLWIKSAYALKARYYLHLTKAESQLNFDPAEEALIALENAFTSGDEDLEYKFGFSVSEKNPFTSGKNSTDLKPTNYFPSLVNEDDPRAIQFFKETFGQISSGLYYHRDNIDQPTSFISYSELKFIEAEARIRINENDPEAEVAFQEAVGASIAHFCAKDELVTSDSIDSYVSQMISLSGTFEEKLEQIITEKYISLYSHYESWTDYRRTGYPALTPHPDGDHIQNPGGAIPRRLVYPLNEIVNNGTNVPSDVDDLQDRFWWDQ